MCIHKHGREMYDLVYENRQVKWHLIPLNVMNKNISRKNAKPLQDARASYTHVRASTEAAKHSCEYYRYCIPGLIILLATWNGNIIMWCKEYRYHEFTEKLLIAWLSLPLKIPIVKFFTRI